ncbi:ATP-binding cassette domain-containing protein [Candidatus Protochlamydia sp. W-9]|uniref:ATP-binding cassette domain-containing protein n=1 Tax=Candidatus Protochlamydia sp. W-9 TaxID=1785087 RepID=UPI00096A2CC0|nr:ATP-binding cassette domain-containing protein [Candidatus Protochlamydia sp. W-9]
MTEALVFLQNVSKIFDPNHPPALSSLSAKLMPGKMIGIAGPDGAGKTTLLRLIAGLLLPSSGSITVAKYDTVQQAKHIHSLIGYMPQKFGLYEDLTVDQNLALYADLKGLEKEERKEIFDKLLDFTGLKPFTKRLAGALSGGMKQKLGLACTLLRKPQLLLLDEPNVGVDPISRRELWRMVQDLITNGITVLWSTAYLDEAEKCDSVILLNEGQLLYHGSPYEFAERVRGRTFKLTHLQGNRREILTHILNQPFVKDGIIQGNDIRLVTENSNVELNPLSLPAGLSATVIPILPRFEDAFVDILGGGPKGPSPLALQIPQISGSQKEIIQARDLVKKFGAFTAADHINFTIEEGEIFGLLGPNGAGKSTTFKMMCGLLKPTAGSAIVNGLNLQLAPGKVRSQIGYMAQKFSLYGNLSVSQNLNFFSGIYNLRGKHRQKMIDQMIVIFGLQDYLNKSAETLPLGLKQRLALSCSLMHYPKVLFLDEPTSGVDPITRREFWNHINGLVKKGVTVMVTTHFMEEAEYCDRIGLIYRSRLIQVGTPENLKSIAKTVQNPYPTLEDAFIHLIEEYEKENST